MKYMNWCVYAEAGKFFQTIYFRKLPFYTHIVKTGNTAVLPHGRITRCKDLSSVTSSILHRLRDTF